MYKLVAFILHSVNDIEITGMYTELIKKNEKMPDPRAGSTPVLSGMCPHILVQVHGVTNCRVLAYSAACLASVNVTIPPEAIALTVPADWDGPNGTKMGLPAAVLTVITTALIGIGGIWIVSSM